MNMKTKFSFVFFGNDKVCVIVFSGGTGGVMLHTNMELLVLPVQQAMLEAAGTTSATKVGEGHSLDNVLT